MTDFLDTIDSLTQQRQRQDALLDQLRDLIVVANRLGMYDAADFLGTATLPGRNYRD